MSKTIRIKRGLDIPLSGESELSWGQVEASPFYAIKPSDFHGIRPKLLLREGAKVKAGTPVFFDKGNEKVMFCSPVSGEITEIVRGAKRVLLEIHIKADGKNECEDFKLPSFESAGREEIIDTMLKSGVWPMIKQRPWNVIANPDTSPRSIFISAFDSSPLAADNSFIFDGQEALFQTGLDILKKLTDGPVHLCIPGKGKVASAFSNAKGVEIPTVNGPHPAGNVGVQIHHIEPLNNKDIIWTCNPQDVLSIARLFTEGRYNPERVFNLCGSQVKDRKYFKSFIGAELAGYLKDNLSGKKNRVISGNVLTGTHVGMHGYLGYYDHQVTVIPEGDYYEFLGWIEPGFSKFSTSGSIASKWFLKNKKRVLDTQMHGGQRAYMVTGEYDKVLPFDILPVHLIKAIMIEDIDLMEKLGIYEVAPEDFALCEVACTSKIDVQEVIQDGIDLMVKELS